MLKSFWSVLLGIGLAAPAAAQTPATPVPATLKAWPLRTIAASDTSFADLAPLAAAIGSARVVFLGELTHGEGESFAAKARLVNFLHRRLGFNLLAFESGFYEVGKAQQERASGQPLTECLQKSLFPIWTSTQEFQALLPVLQSPRLQLAGFDSQFSGSYQDELADDLQEFLRGAPRAATLPFEPLAAAITALAETFHLPSDLPYADLARLVQQFAPPLQAAASQGSPAHRQYARLWLQRLRNLEAQARISIHQNPDSLNAANFRYRDTNERDAQMAANLLFLTREHPQAKIICWGASAHFANRIAALQNPEMADGHPMGQVFRAQYPGAVYSLAVAVGGGSHGMLGTAAQPVPPPAPGSLEAALNQQDHPYAFVNLHQELENQSFAASLLGHEPLTGQWSQVFDGVLFLQTVTPPHLIGAVAQELSPPAVPAAAAPPVAGAAARLANAATHTIQGQVVDAATGQPVEFASVQWGRTAYGTTTDAHGRFALEVPAAGPAQQLLVSEMGYQTLTVPVTPADLLVVRLPPAAYGLSEVVVSARRLDARQLLAEAIRRIPTNYVQQDFNARVYTHAVATNLDSVLRDSEYTALLYDQDGYHDRRFATSQVEEKRLNRQAVNNSGSVLHFVGGCPHLNDSDALLSPLFSAGKLSRFELTLLPTTTYAGQEVYALAFRAKRLGHATTADYFIGSYSGKIYLNAADFAVVRSEMRWVRDTLKLNRVSRHAYTPTTALGQKFRVLAEQNEHRTVMTYQRDATGHYFPAATLSEWTVAGYDVLRQRNTRMHSAARSVYYDIKTQSCQPVVYEHHAYQPQIDLRFHPYNPEFWAHYTPPVAP